MEILSLMFSGTLVHFAQVEATDEKTNRGVKG
jgi:hypothetical protein